MFDPAELEREIPRLRNFAQRFYRIMDPADLVQDTLMLAWRARDQFRESASLYTWLCRILVNCAFDAQRRRRRRPNSVSFPPGFDVVDSGVGPERVLLEKERSETLRAAIVRLPVVLRFGAEDYLSDSLTDTNTARTRRRRALIALRQKMRLTDVTRSFS